MKLKCLRGYNTCYVVDEALVYWHCNQDPAEPIATVMLEAARTFGILAYQMLRQETASRSGVACNSAG